MDFYYRESSVGARRYRDICEWASEGELKVIFITSMLAGDKSSVNKDLRMIVRMSG